MKLSPARLSLLEELRDGAAIHFVDSRDPHYFVSGSHRRLRAGTVRFLSANGLIQRVAAPFYRITNAGLAALEAARKGGK